MTRVRNGNEDAVVAQNEQGTKHCGPVASDLSVMVGCSQFVTARCLEQLRRAQCLIAKS